jgi:ABC-type amino acid transport substrate-binding protein
MHRACTWTLAALLLGGVASCATSPQTRAEDDQARGRAQLIRAIDTAFINFIASRRDREILKTEPPNRPGAALGYALRIADCLPAPELVSYPEEPVGLFKDILDSGKIREVIQNTTSTPEDTSYYFSGISRKTVVAIFQDIGKHYGVELEIVSVPMPPGKLPGTSMLLDGEADFVGPLNATGGKTQNMRRRASRRFSCTLTGSIQHLHVPADSSLAAEINTWDDMLARPDLRICAGALSTQTIRAFLPNNPIKTRYVKDLGTCIRDVESGQADVISNPLPDLSITDVDGWKAIATPIVTGVPLWTALEGIICPGDGDPETVDACVEVNPL